MDRLASTVPITVFLILDVAQVLNRDEMPVESQSDPDADRPVIVMVRRTRQRLYDGTDAKLVLFPTLANILLNQIGDEKEPEPEPEPEPEESAAAAAASADAKASSSGTNPS